MSSSMVISTPASGTRSNTEALSFSSPLSEPLSTPVRMFDLTLRLNTDFFQKLSELYVEDFLVHNHLNNQSIPRGGVL